MSSNTISQTELESTLRTLQTLYKEEHDSDHKASLGSAMGVLVKQYTGDSIGDITTPPTKNDVSIALEVLSEHGEEYDGIDRMLVEAHDFSRGRKSRYLDRCKRFEFCA